MKADLSTVNAGKVALITGSAARIGASIAKHLHKAGFNIALHYNHTQHAAETLSKELNDIRTNSAYCFEADLKNLKAIQQLEKIHLHIGIKLMCLSTTHPVFTLRH